MLSHAINRLVSAGRDESGFTLIEVLVTIGAATIVAGALFAILNFSAAQTANLTDRVQADQLGGQAMTSIVDELHSACLSPAFAPIQEKSSPSELIFINSNSKEAEIGSASKATEVHKHKIKWESASGTLVDYAYSATGGTWPTFTFSEAAGTYTKTQLASHVSESEAESKKIPVFQYYKYAEASNQNESTPDSTLNTSEPLTGTLTSATAKEASSVLVSFSTAPTNTATTIGPTATDRTIAQSDQVTFAFSIPNPETPIHDSPCQ